MFHNVCRLCLGTEELIWIFNEKMADNMPEIIEVTSGVQITKSDTVTQMVCSTCCQITIKMYKFRTTSIKNDRDLKARCAGYNISQLRNSIVHTKQEGARSSAATVAACPNVTNTTIKASVTSNTNSPPALQPTPAPPPTPPVPRFHIPQKFKFAHPSIKEIIKQNPNIQLPEISMRSHFGAYITLLTDEVDDWYKDKKFTDSQIVEIKKAAASYATELEIPTPAPLRKKRRKSSIESACSSSSRKSSSDKSVTESGGIKRKRIRLNGDIPLKSNADATTGTVPKMVISVTKSTVSTVDKTNVHASSNSSASTAMKVDSNSNSNIKVNANVDSSVKTEINIPAWGVNVSTKSSASVKSNITQSSVTKPSAKIDVGSTVTNVSNTETKPKETLHMGTVLHSLLLPKEGPPKGRQEEITLSSILRSAENTKSVLADPASDSDGNDAGDDPSYEPDPSDVASDTEVIEIDEPGKKNERTIRSKTDQPQNRTKPKDEYTLFTTRPFVRNASNVRQSKLDLRMEDCNEGELLVLSDSDDDVAKENQSSIKKVGNGADNNDPIIVEIDETSGLQSSKENNSDQNKEPDLPNSDPNKATNMPDLSLVTVTHKSNTLFTCKVCDGHYHNIKDLKIHERRTHTKCPFCNKKFRSLSSRDEHVKYTCIINNAPFELKNFKLELTRVDEIEEIRKQYASAFEEMDYINEETQSNDSAEVSSTATVSEAPSRKSPSVPLLPPVENTEKRQEEETVDAVSEFERFLQSAPVTRSPSEQTTSVTLTEGSSNSNETIAAESVAEVGATSTNCDIICISDDEADTSSTKEPRGKPKIKILNNDTLKHINLQDNDINVLRKIIAKARLSKTVNTVAIDALKNNSIVDGGTSRVKVFKNLRKHLQHYKIPIEIKYSPNLTVEYKYAAQSPQRKQSGLWYGMAPHDLKVSNIQLSKPQPPCNTATVPPSYNPTVATVPPSYNPTVATVPPSYSTTASQVKNASLILRNQQSGSVVSQIVTSTNNIFNTVVSQSPVFATMPQLTPIVSSTLGTTGSTVSSSSNFLFTSQPPPLVATSMNDHSYSNRPVVLNNAQTMCATNTTNNITNFILLSGAILPAAGKITETSLPAAQGPLPIIQYVTSAQEQQEPITITEESCPEASSTTTTTATAVTVQPTTATVQSTAATVQSTAATMQPAIRVKNLSELS